jgi:capsular polysaccharide biosynthesis protein/Mrp family chromosome partitioning ATPase
MFGSLRANAGLVVFAMAILALASLLHATRNPVYTASSQLLLGPSPTQAALRPVDQKQFDRMTATFELSAEAEAAILPSEVVARRVARALKLTIPPQELANSITASSLSDAVVEVQASAPDPLLAEQLANGFADQYLVYRSQVIRQAVAGVLREFDARSAEVRAEIGRLDTRPDPPPGAASRTSADSDANQQAASSERERLLAVEQSLDLEATRLRAVASADAADGAVIARARAATNGSPANEAVRVGLVVGGALGGALALLRSHAHAAGNIAAKVEAVTGMPVLARTSMDGSEPHAAGYQATPSEVLFARGLGRTLRSVLLVAADQGDDVTAVAVDLAVACADAGLPTVAFSAESPHLTVRQSHEQDASWIERLISVGGNLMVLRGTVPAGRIEEMMEAVRQFSIVVIEGPSLSESNVAITIAEYSDIVLLVTAAGARSRQALEEAGRALVILDRPLQGVVLTDPRVLGQSA